MADLLIDIEKLKYNIFAIKKICKENNLGLMGIVKACFTCRPVIKAFADCEIMDIGFSRIEVGSHCEKDLSNHTRTLIAITIPEFADETVKYFTGSYHSEIESIQSVSESSKKFGIDHHVTLIVDNGDLREGVLPDDAKAYVKQILEMQTKNSHLKFAGLAANLGCCSGILPSNENLGTMNTITMDIEKDLGIDVPTLSLGGSIMLDWLSQKPLPEKISQLRVGETILLGNVPIINRHFEGLHSDVFTYRTTALEVKDKPSMPKGELGLDALGRKPTFYDKGIRKRAILNFGAVDTDPWALQPRGINAEIINSNSEYTIADITENNDNVKSGTVIDFSPGYSALIRAFLSPFVRKIVINENQA